jgi:ABC-type bacteriocin/lantibiotic exporter with double-glycine peptidase domain
MMGLLAQLFTLGEEEVIGTTEFPRHIQWDGYSCGARCVRMLTTYFGVNVTYEHIVNGIGMTQDGSSATPIVKYLRSCGLSAGYHRSMSWRQLEQALRRQSVVIVDLDNAHWCIVHAMSPTWVWMANPSLRQLGRQVHHETFERRWTGLGITVSDRRRSR